MNLLNRKSRLQRLVESLGGSLAAADALKSALPGDRGPAKTLSAHLPSVKDLKGGVPKDTAVKAGLVAGGLTVLTAGSTGISSLRRRKERAADDS